MVSAGTQVEPSNLPSRALSIGLVARGNPSHPSGSAERILQTYRALRTQGDVVLYVLTQAKPEPRPGQSNTEEQVVWIPLTGRRVLPHDYLASLIGWRPRRLMAASPRHQRHIAEGIMSPHHDVIWTYSDRAYFSLPARLRRASYVVADLIDFEDQRDIELGRRADKLSFFRVILAKVDARALRRTLRGIVRSADRTVISSELDRQRLGSEHVVVLPNTYSLIGESVGRPEQDRSPSFLFVGLLAYGPNVDAVHWLVDEVWPRVQRECPDAELRIVGRGLAPDTFSTARGVTVVGEVERIEDELCGATATLAPLRAGSGTRIKILEGWAHRVPVVATSVGAEGLDYRHERDLLIANSSAEFAAAMLRVASDKSLRQSLADNGKTLWSERYSPTGVESIIAGLLSHLHPDADRTPRQP